MKYFFRPVHLRKETVIITVDCFIAQHIFTTVACWNLTAFRPQSHAHQRLLAMKILVTAGYTKTILLLLLLLEILRLVVVTKQNKTKRETNACYFDSLRVTMKLCVPLNSLHMLLPVQLQEFYCCCTHS